tara:strand:+ start:907 stop:1287 length:381 start_codon:yes stop_codon:yes gene_type:complete
MVILPIGNDPELYKKIHELAEADDDSLFYPSHYAVHDGEIVGAFSLVTPVSCWWMSKKKGTRLMSLQMWNALEALHADQGNMTFVMPCTHDSPYFKLMEKPGGFQKLGEPVQWFYKILDPSLKHGA